MRSHAELLEASGYGNRPKDFDDLIRILDSEIRLITPTDPEGKDADDDSVTQTLAGQKYFQLTHDYLVHSLREWLTRKQKETRRGRAELKLEERSALWNAKPENRHLPSLLEWASIRTLTEKKKWTEPQRKLMRKAGRVHGVRSSIALTFLIVASVIGVTIRHSILEDREIVQARNIEQQNLTRAEGLVESLLKADTAQVPVIIADMTVYRKWANPKLSEAFDQSSENSKERLHASLALLPVDPTQVGYLKRRLFAADPEDIVVIRIALVEHKESILNDLWQIIEQPSKEEETQLLQAASALALYDSENERWKLVADKVARTVVNEKSFRVPNWIKLLQPIRGHLLESLGDIYRNGDGDFSQAQMDLATEILERYAADDVETLAELMFDAQPKQFVTLFDEFAAHGGEALSKLNEELDRELTFNWNDSPLDPSWSEPTAEITARIKQANGMISERFAFCQTMPLKQFVEVAELLRKSGYRPIRFRPFAHKDSVQVASVLTRDGRDWQLLHGLTAEAIRQRDEEFRNKGFVPLDVAGYVGEAEEEPAEQYGGIWVKRHTDEEDARMYVGATSPDSSKVLKTFSKTGYNVRNSLQSYQGLDGQQKYCGVMSNTGGTSYGSLNSSPTDYENKKYLDRISWDINISNAAKMLRYAAVWQTSVEYESQELHGLSPKEQLERCRELISNGYRPVAISAASIGAKGEHVTASVWHRPLVPEDEKEQLAKRQANAAVALLKMGHTEDVWPLLKHSSDPRLRTWIIHRLSPMGASPESIVKRLGKEPDVSIRRALILILGEYEDASQVDREALSVGLLKLYRDDPDSGIHGAVEWVLQRWDKTEDLAKIDAELATGKVKGERNWYLTKQGHTMVLFPGPVEFLMGSPSTEQDRRSVEYLHRKRIGRSFAIATKEVTVRQFQEFLRNTPSVQHTYTKRYAPEENCPQISVSWYEGAAYCRWLSEQEGIAEDQMCFPPVAEIKAGMKLPADYLSRKGYRLPSEAEWELSCRSQTATSRHYGQTDELLGHYAWYNKTSQDRTWPVGSLKPNETGLFDMQGNVFEWCQEHYVSYGGGLGSVSEDREDKNALDDTVRRSMRGGSFGYQTSVVRTAYRSDYLPTDRFGYCGFRPSRTYDLSP